MRQPDQPIAGLLLTLDTATEQAGVGLFDGERLAELSWFAGREQTVSVLGQAHALLTLTRRSVQEITAVAVAIGPGTFTGLRVGLSIAKGLILGLAPATPLIGVPTLAITAWPLAGIGLPIVAVAAAGRGRLVWATFDPAMEPRTHPINGTVEALVAELGGIGERVLVTGELTPPQEDAVATVPTVILPPRLLRTRRPAALAHLAWNRYQAGETDSLAALEPLYISR